MLGRPRGAAAAGHERREVAFEVRLGQPHRRRVVDQEEEIEVAVRNHDAAAPAARAAAGAAPPPGAAARTRPAPAACAGRRAVVERDGQRGASGRQRLHAAHARRERRPVAQRRDAHVDGLAHRIAVWEIDLDRPPGAPAARLRVLVSGAPLSMLTSIDS